MTNSFVRFLGELEDTKKSFQNHLTFSGQKVQNRVCIVDCFFKHSLKTRFSLDFCKSKDFFVLYVIFIG